MPLNGSTILDGATVSASGGSAKTFTVTGQKVNGGVFLIDASVTDYRTRPTMTAVSSQPTLMNDGKSFTKGKSTLCIAFPFSDAQGVQQYPCLRITLESHPEMSTANLAKLKNYAAQSLIDADFTSFWDTGSLA